MEHSFIWILRMFQHSRPNVWLVPLQFEFKFVKHDLAYALDLIYFLGVGDDMGSSKLKYCSFWSLFARNQDSICVLRSANLLEGILYKNDSWTKIFVLTFFYKTLLSLGCTSPLKVYGQIKVILPPKRAWVCQSLNFKNSMFTLKVTVFYLFFETHFSLGWTSPLKVYGQIKAILLAKRAGMPASEFWK